MKTLYNADGSIVDNFDTVDAAILLAIGYWHEHKEPQAYVIKDEDNMIAATVAPVGSDTAIVVWAHGQIDRWQEITYHTEHGRYQHTSARYCNAALATKIKNGTEVK
jgi:hypothetical protein